MSVVGHFGTCRQESNHFHYKKTAIYRGPITDNPMAADSVQFIDNSTVRKLTVKGKEEN